MLLQELQPLWDRLKADNHEYYKYVLAQGAKDNTTAPRYNSLGSWSAVAYRMSGDRAFAQRSFDHVKNLWPEKTFASAPLWAGDMLRENGTEMVVTLDRIRDGIADADMVQWRDWLIRIAEKYLLGNMILGDTDQVTGSMLFYAALDKAHGTKYMSNARVIQMRDKFKWFCEVLAEGGEWMESSDYNLNTLYLMLNGVEAVGLDQFPEVAELYDPIARTFMQWFTPDLRDTFEWGDDQTPHTPPWHLVEDLCAILSRRCPEVPAFEVELRDIWKKPFGTSFYSRYFAWADPYAPRTLNWRSWAGTFHVAKGQGHVYARTGWTPSDRAIMAMMPTFSKAVVDHWYPIFGDFRVRDGGRWMVDRPQGYTGNLKLGNHTVIAGVGAPVEVGDLTGTYDSPALSYVSGTNAGVSAYTAQYYQLQTLLHERSVSLYWLKDRNVLVHVLRLHLDDVTALDRYFGTAEQKAAALAEPPIASLWQSQSVQPTIEAGVIYGDARIAPMYPSTCEVIDQAPLALGSIYPSEKKWYVRVIPQVVGTFQVLTTIIGGALGAPVDAVLVNVSDDVQLVRIKARPGTSEKDVLIYSSRKRGEKLITSYTVNQWGGKGILLDNTKIKKILPARDVAIEEVWREGAAAADVYVEQSGSLVKLVAPPPPPPPPPSGRRWVGIEESDGRIVLTREAL